MDFHMKLPRNGKEFILFMVIISIISVNIIAPLITFFEVGFHFNVWLDTLKVIPFIWICVVILVLVTKRPAEIMTEKIMKDDKSYVGTLTVNILCNVLLMSIILTVVGTWIGCRSITPEPIIHFFYKWPRNYAISFFVEACIAQPIARFVMLKLHQSKDSAQQTPAV